ncbi:hypothetical protein ID866_12806 [Astraeus odoratus]|nr:hypothetical protein ID866_12806 [Astraeus odoratus]
MDVANGHLEWIASAVQSNSWKMQQHFLLMEGLVGQQQLLVSKLVKMKLQGGESGGQEEIQGVPGGVLEGEPEYVLGEEPEDGTGAEDGAGEEGQESKAKDKGKQKAL